MVFGYTYARYKYLVVQSCTEKSCLKHMHTLGGIIAVSLLVSHKRNGIGKLQSASPLFLKIIFYPLSKCSLKLF